MTVVVGLGGNIGSDDEIVARFRFVRDQLARDYAPIASARLYRSEPIGRPQRAFLNTALAFAPPPVAPSALLAQLHALERSCGRVRDELWGPRTLDLDILMWSDRAINQPDLVVPHRRLIERRFALAPLVDVVGDLEIVGAGMARQLLAATAAQSITVIADDW